MTVSYNIKHILISNFTPVYPKQMETYIHTKTCIRMFTAILFIIVKIGKNPNIHQ